MNQCTYRYIYHPKQLSNLLELGDLRFCHPLQCLKVEKRKMMYFNHKQSDDPRQKLSFKVQRSYRRGKCFRISGTTKNLIGLAAKTKKM